MTIPIRGIIFDLDGTLIHQELDFEALRAEIGLPSGTPLLEALTGMTHADRTRAENILARHEAEAAQSAVALPGVAALLQLIDAAGLRRGILTRNSISAANVALAQAKLADFDPIVAREHAAFKPDPAGVLLACRHWQLEPCEVLVVGDYVFDVRAGVNAGARTALVTHGKHWPFAAEADFTFPAFDPLPEPFRTWLGFE